MSFSGNKNTVFQFAVCLLSSFTLSLLLISCRFLLKPSSQNSSLSKKTHIHTHALSFLNYSPSFHLCRASSRACVRVDICCKGVVGFLFILGIKFLDEENTGFNLMMDSVRSPSVARKSNKLARSVAKVLHIRAMTGVAPVDGIRIDKLESETNSDNDKKKSGKTRMTLSQSFEASEDDEEVLALESVLAKSFASIACIKAAYAQLQYAQSPYDGDGVQVADQVVVSELKSLSELKQSYMKKQFDPFPETSIVSADLKELESVSKTYEIMGKKLESQLRLKDSEITYLKEKLDEFNKQNRLLEKRLNQSGQLSALDSLQLHKLSPGHFITVLRVTVKSIRSFVKLMIDEMKSTNWDLDLAVSSIAPNVVFWREDDKCFAFESFVCRVMFDGFHLPKFSPSVERQKNQKQLFFNRFTELKPLKVMEYLTSKPRSAFAKFCRAKFSQFIHPKMEASFFGNMSHRNILKAGEIPDSSFFNSFAEMAKRVWLLHCLAFSFEPEASIFQVESGSRFSEVYMECVHGDALLLYENALEADPPVAFTVVPGFRINKTMIQCQVFLSRKYDMKSR